MNKNGLAVLRRPQTGFTFIELLVVMTLIAVLTVVGIVSYTSSAQRTRDVRRKRDLAQIQVALEAYKQTYGAYPDHTGCSGSGTWPGCATPWITGLSADYMANLPSDPKQNATAFIGNTSDETYTYNYVRPTVTTYRLLTRLENENDTDINGSSFGYSGSQIYVVSEPR